MSGVRFGIYLSDEDINSAIWSIQRIKRLPIILSNWNYESNFNQYFCSVLSLNLAPFYFLLDFYFPFGFSCAIQFTSSSWHRFLLRDWNPYLFSLLWSLLLSVLRESTVSVTWNQACNWTVPTSDTNLETPFVYPRLWQKKEQYVKAFGDARSKQ